MILVTIVIGLVIVIFINGGKGGENSDSQGMEENPSSTDEFPEIYLSEADKKEVDKIYNNNPNNLTKVIDYFTERFKEREPSEMHAGHMADSEIEWFEARNITDKTALLDGLTRLDYSSLTELRALYYEKIIKIAEELNRTDIVEQYKKLWNESREDHLAALELTKKDLEDALKRMEEDDKDLKDVTEKKYEYILSMIKRYQEDMK